MNLYYTNDGVQEEGHYCSHLSIGGIGDIYNVHRIINIQRYLDKKSALTIDELVDEGTLLSHRTIGLLHTEVYCSHEWTKIATPSIMLPITYPGLCNDVEPAILFKYVGLGYINQRLDISEEGFLLNPWGEIRTIRLNDSRFNGILSSAVYHDGQVLISQDVIYQHILSDLPVKDDVLIIPPGCYTEGTLDIPKYSPFLLSKFSNYHNDDRN